MKRSEMIQYIQSELKDMLDSIEVRPNAKRYAPKRFASNILDMIEGFGMLPPACYNETYLDNPECDRMIYKWEPEGDTND